jgi:hypothetical protein
MGFPKYAENVLALGVIQTVIRGGSSGRHLQPGFAAQFRQGYTQGMAVAQMTERSMRFSSSRTLPGHDHSVSAVMVSLGMVSMLRSMRAANL